MRKQILKFDDILNDQRKIIDQNRKEILSTNDQSIIILLRLTMLIYNKC